MPLVDLPKGAQLDPPPDATFGNLPIGAQLDGQQMGGILRTPAMIASGLAKGVAQGAGAIGDLQGLMQMGVDAAYAPLRRAVTGSNPPMTPITSNLGSSELLRRGVQIGAVDRPELQPQTKGERLLAAGAEGVGGMLPFAPLGAGSAAVNLARGAVQGGAGGATGEAAADLFPNHPLLARLGGNILGAVGGGAAFNAGNRIAGAATGASTPTLDAYRALGIKPTLAGDVTGSPTAQMIQAYAARAPGGAGRVHAASEKAVEQWGRALEDTASNIGQLPFASRGRRGAAIQCQNVAWHVQG